MQEFMTGLINATYAAEGVVVENILHDDKLLIDVLAKHKNSVVAIRPKCALEGCIHPPFSIKEVEVENHSREDSVGGTTIWIDAEEY